ncbi:hypothetical protein [Epibacterium ulvae]|nr:hypothetical protein [Epibacterium ulvae]
MTKQVYTIPVLRIHGKVEAVTEGLSTGSRLDSSFPPSSPRGDLTFS